jgi:hypothetical protein
VVNARPRPLYPREKETLYPFCRRVGGPQGWSGRVRKISLPPEFDPRTDILFVPVLISKPEKATNHAYKTVFSIQQTLLNNGEYCL